MNTDPENNGTGRDGAPWRNFYGRIHGKTLRPTQKAALANDLDGLTLHGVSRGDNPQRRPLDLSQLAGAEPLWLEIGFGGGEHLVAMAARYPGVRIIGAEPYVNGIAMLLGKVAAAGVSNLAIHPGDVRDLFDVLPQASVHKAFLNYPDPWPKRRHHRRRFVTQDHLRPLLQLMAPGGELRLATDIVSYVEQARREVPAAGFERLAHDEGQPWADWPSTRYEHKALREGRPPHYLTFRRPQA